MEKLAPIAARILLAQIFLITGIGKISGYAGSQAYMEAMGVPGALLPGVIALEVGGALALITGYGMRWAALALAVFSVIAALLFHHDLADKTQMIMFLKNLAIAGGLLLLVQREAAAASA